MDPSTAADRLYGLDPEDFTAARDELVRALRKEGRRDAAKEIGGLRRPTIAAWAANRLARAEPEEAGRLLELGEELRRAHRELDGSQLRELIRVQRELVGALARTAYRLAEDAGRPLGDGARYEVEQTLHAVLADPDAAREWAAGRLTKALDPAGGFPDTAGAARAAGAATRPAARTRKEPSRTRKRTETGTDARAVEEAEAARREAERAAGEEDRRRAELSAAEEERRRADERRTAAGRQLAELRDRLREAEGEQRDAQADAKRTAERARRAEKALREAEREARTAARTAERAAERAEGHTGRRTVGRKGARTSGGPSARR